MQLKIWLRMTWTDTRLAWNEAEYGGITETFFHGEGIAGGETTEIWLPDISVYNGNSGLGETMEPGIARVRSNGEVYYSRPGTLDVLCKYSGLVAFPRDMLKCSVEFGGWLLSGVVQGIYLQDGGFSFSSQELTSGASYQEFESA